MLFGSDNPVITKFLHPFIEEMAQLASNGIYWSKVSEMIVSTADALCRIWNRSTVNVVVLILVVLWDSRVYPHSDDVVEEDALIFYKAIVEHNILQSSSFSRAVMRNNFRNQ